MSGDYLNEVNLSSGYSEQGLHEHAWDYLEGPHSKPGQPSGVCLGPRYPDVQAQFGSHLSWPVLETEFQGLELGTTTDAPTPSATPPL